MSTYYGIGQIVLLETAATTQVFTGSCIIERIIVIGGTISIYDHASSSTNLVLKDIDQSIDVGGKLRYGMRVVTTGATVNISVIYS